MNHYIFIGGILLIYCLFSWRLIITNSRIKKLEAAEDRRKATHQQIYEMQSDPDVIMAVMERSAVASEALRAKRTLTIRENAGPPAIIHRPPTRAPYPHGRFERKDGIWPDVEVDTSKNDD